MLLSCFNGAALSRNIRWGEYRRIANDPITLLVLWFCKLCRIPFPIMKGLPLPDSQRHNLLGADELPEAVRLRWQPVMAELERHGFHAPLTYGLRDNLSSQFNFVRTMRHASGEVVARLGYFRLASAPDQAAKVRVTFQSRPLAGGFLETSNGKQEFDVPPGSDSVWHPGLALGEVWQRHQARMEARRSQGGLRPLRTEAEVEQTNEENERESFAHLEQRGILREMSPAEVDQLRSMTPGAGGVDENAPVLAELTALQAAKRNWVNGVLLLLVTMALFAAAGSWQWKPETALALVPILLFHEAGHFLAMRLFGYQNVKMFFIPFFGAAVSGLQLRAPAWKKAVVSLAGPLPGIAVGAVLAAVAAVTGEQWPVKAALLLLILNGFNLLPFLPLDGGWLLNAVIFARNRWAESVFRAIAALALIGLGVMFHDRILPIVGGFMLLGLRHSHRIGEITDRLRARNFPPDLPTAQRISPEYAVQILVETRAALPAKPVLPPKQLAQMVMSIYERLHTPAPGLGASLALLAAYAGGLAASVIFAGVMFWQKMEQKTARAGKAVEAAVPYERGDLLALGNRAALAATNRSVVIGTFKSPADARATATNSLSQLGPQDALTQFGQTIVVTLPDAVGKRADGWRGVFAAFATNLVVGLSNHAPSVTLVATAPDEATVDRLHFELERWFRAGFAPPPWRREPEPPARRAEMNLAWRTGLQVNKALARVSLHPDYKQASKEFSRSFSEKDKAVREAASAKFNAVVRRLNEAALAELKQSTNSPLDMEVVRLRTELVSVSTNLAARIRLEAELSQRTGVPTWPMNDIPAYGPEAVRVATLKREGTTLRCEWMIFQQVETGLPALADYFVQQGCHSVRYGLAPNVADDDF